LLTGILVNYLTKKILVKYIYSDLQGGRDDLSVHEILRGKERRQYTFLVLEQDSSLKEDMAKANSMEDRWKRREAWRRLAGQDSKGIC